MEMLIEPYLSDQNDEGFIRSSKLKHLSSSEVVDLHNHISHLKLSFFHFISSFLLLPSQRGPETKINKREKEE